MIMLSQIMEEIVSQNDEILRSRCPRMILTPYLKKIYKTHSCDLITYPFDLVSHNHFDLLTSLHFDLLFFLLKS